MIANASEYQRAEEELRTLEDRLGRLQQGHPIGAKGVGESPNVGGVPAFSNAINDAFAFLGGGNIAMPHDHWRTWTVAERLGLHK